MWMWFVLIQSVFAAWPDSFEHRIAAMEALRYDLAMPGIPHNPNQVLSKYQVACDKGYFDVCHPEEWVGMESSNPLKAAALMESKCQKSNSPLQCVVVGMAYGMENEQISATAPNPKKAFAAFQTACEKKAYAPGCTYLGDMYLAGVGVSQDKDKARSYYEEACKAKDVWGCHRLGDFFAEIKTNAKERLEYYQQSCQYGYELGCMAQATLMMDTAKSQAEWRFIASQLDRACKYGQLNKCAILASLYQNGKGVQRSLPLANALYQSTCAGGVSASCHAIGTLYLEQIPPNYKMAADTFFTACEGGYSPSCTRYGALALKGNGVSQNVEFALRYMNKGCNSGDLEGCLVLAQAYSDGAGVSRNPTLAKELAQQTCDAGFGQGCYVLAQLGEAEGTWGMETTVDSSALYKQSCTLGYGHGCAEIALRDFSNGQADDGVQQKLDVGCMGEDVRACLAMGQILQGEPEHSMQYLDVACSLDSMDACLSVGRFWESSQDITKASEYYDRVCTFGDERGCQALEPIAFQGKFEGLIQRAWLNNFCQVWAEDTDGMQLVAEASGATMKLHSGHYVGSDVTVWHLGNTVVLDVIQRGESRWNIGGKLPNQKNIWQTGEELDHTQVTENTTDPWGADQAMDWDVSLTHIEEWDASKGEITRDFPGDVTLAMGDKGIIKYSRPEETLFGQCGYVGGHTTLRTEHCSDIQSLMLGYLFMDCTVQGQLSLSQ